MSNPGGYLLVSVTGVWYASTIGEAMVLSDKHKARIYSLAGLLAGYGK